MESAKYSYSAGFLLFLSSGFAFGSVFWFWLLVLVGLFVCFVLDFVIVSVVDFFFLSWNTNTLQLFCCVHAHWKLIRTAKRRGHLYLPIL